ncbi:MAG: ABC transporter substrate-binding protein [Bacteroides sp.]
MKKLLYLLALALFLLSGCNTKKPVKAKVLQKISLGVMPSMASFPFMIAQDKDIYDTLGVQIELIKFASDHERDEALRAGKIDGSVMDFADAALLQAKGTELKLVMNNEENFYLIMGKYAHINNPNQMKGKNIAITSHSAIEYIVDKGLEKVGINTEEVNKPEINNSQLCLEMLQSGQIDATVFTDPLATIAKHCGHQTLPLNKEMKATITGTAFTQKALVEKSEEIRLLIYGYNIGVNYLSTHSRADWSALLTEQLSVPEKLIKKVQLPDYQPASIPSRTEIKATIQWLKDAGRVPTTYFGEQLIDTTFIYKQTSQQK